MKNEKSLDQQIVDVYRTIVAKKHPAYISGWPILTGYDIKTASYKGWKIVIFINTRNSVIKSSSGLGELSYGPVGYDTITFENKNQVRERLIRHLRLNRSDAIFIFDHSGQIDDDLEYSLLQHEIEMGLRPMKIFLSHKGADKPMVREFKKILEELGFDPWLDEDAMTAGVELERGILQGFKDSCAAVFFVTPNFQDEAYLSTEVNYAIQQKREKGDKFAIVTIVFAEGNRTGIVPELLKQYVWKEPASEIEAFREILRAIPVKVGDVKWK
jgi:hypothetical protein